MKLNSYIILLVGISNIISGIITRQSDFAAAGVVISMIAIKE